MHVTVQCPRCNYQKVVNGRGRCRCGVYLIDHWNGSKRGRSMILPYGTVYVREDGAWRLLKDDHDPASDRTARHT